jgi:spermidine synthase
VSSRAVASSGRDLESGRVPFRLGLLVTVAGATTLGAEIAAARLLAPYFGASTLIWANTIAVVLVALSVGYWLGGKMSDRHPVEARLRVTVLVAAVMLALVPLAAGPFFGVVVEAFDRLAAGAFLGSLFSVLTLVAAPLVLLGMVSPWAIRLALHSVADAGSVAGRLYAMSTIGSLLGVFAAALVLVPFIGTQRTFVLMAALLALVAASGLPRRALLVPAAVAGLLLLPPGFTKPAEDPGVRVLYEKESPYQYVRVLEREEGVRRLELNEGQATHSSFTPGRVLTDGVWDGYLALPFAVLREPPRRFAMLGNAAGTVSRAYGRYFPDTVIDGVEIDGAVTEAGRRYFELERANPRLVTHTDDARPFLRRSAEVYDLIGVDAYRQPYIPFYLATEEFFALARARLAPGGAVVVNVGHPEGQDELERALTASMRSAFSNVARWPIEDTNTLLIASDGEVGPANLRRRAPAGPPELRPLMLRAAKELTASMDGGEALTDDRAPVEWLVDASIIDYASGD